MKVERTCIVCRNKFEQNDLYRVVNHNGELLLQTDKKIEGRGAYICKNNICKENLFKRRSVLNKSLKQVFNDEDYKKLLNSLKD